MDTLPGRDAKVHSNHKCIDSIVNIKVYGVSLSRTSLIPSATSRPLRPWNGIHRDDHVSYSITGPSTHQPQPRLKYSGSTNFYRIRNKIKCTVRHKNVQNFALKNLRDLLTSMHAPEMISARPTPADLTKSLMFLNSSLSSNNTCGNISRHSHTGYNMLWFQEFKLWAVKS